MPAVRFLPGLACVLALLAPATTDAQPPASQPPASQPTAPKLEPPAAGKPETPQAVQVVGADAQTGVKVATSTATAVVRIPLEVATGAVKGLTATVDDFVAADGSRVTPRVTLNGKSASEPIDVTQKDRPVLEIAATFASATDYRSYIVLTHAAGRLPSVAFVVTRQRNAIAADIVGLETTTATKWRKASATIRFTVRETANQKAAFYPVAVEGFALKETDKVRKAAHYDRVLVDETPPADAATESFVLEPQQGRQVVVTVQGIRDAGEYTGTLRLANSNGTPVTKDFTVLVKSSIGIAAFWIFLGVAASFGIRRYVKQERPKLQALRRVRYAEEDLTKIEGEAGGAPRPTDTVFAALRDQLARIERSLEDGTAKDNAAVSLDEMDKKIRALPGWITTGRWLDTVKPADIVVSPHVAWEALAGSYFGKVGATDDIAAALAKIEADIKAAVGARIKEFADRVTAYRNTHPTAATLIDQRVLPALSRARDAAASGDWPGMTAAFREARLAHAKVLATEFDGLLARPAPVGFDEAAWTTLTRRITGMLAEIQQETDPERAVDRYDEANGVYLSGVTAKLEPVVTRLRQASPTAGEETTLKSAAESLTAATLALQRKEWETARTKYEAAAKGVTEVLAARAKAGGGAQASTSGQGTAGVSEAVPDGAALDAPIPLGVPSPRAKTTAQQISDMLARYDWYLDLAILVIACVVGTTLLWLNDPVWGGWKAYTTAFLWGLGLHQVAGSTLDGLPAVTKKLTE